MEKSLKTTEKVKADLQEEDKYVKYILSGVYKTSFSNLIICSKSELNINVGGTKIVEVLYNNWTADH